MITLDDVKNYLNITYNDEDTNDKVTGIFIRSEHKIRKLVAASSSDVLTSSEEQLLLDLCRYTFNNAAEDFEANFMNDINGARAERQVAAMEAANNGG